MTPAAFEALVALESEAARLSRQYGVRVSTWRTRKGNRLAATGDQWCIIGSPDEIRAELAHRRSR